MWVRRYFERRARKNWLTLTHSMLKYLKSFFVSSYLKSRPLFIRYSFFGKFWFSFSKHQSYKSHYSSFPLAPTTTKPRLQKLYNYRSLSLTYRSWRIPKSTTFEKYTLNLQPFPCAMAWMFLVPIFESFWVSICLIFWLRGERILDMV